MPGSTPIFGFPYPDPSDLVANYPALGQQLAEDVETEIISSGGLSLITSQTFSAQSSVSVNNCFTTTYQNYRVIIDSNASGNTGIVFRFRASGSDNTTSNYFKTGIYAGNGVAVTSQANSGAAQFDPGVLSVTRHRLTWDILSPQAAERTFVSGINPESIDGILNIYTFVGAFQATTQFDGFTFSVGSGTTTGTIRVYGYKNS
jgi:hypothetical protein